MSVSVSVRLSFFLSVCLSCVHTLQNRLDKDSVGDRRLSCVKHPLNLGTGDHEAQESSIATYEQGESGLRTRVGPQSGTFKSALIEHNIVCCNAAGYSKALLSIAVPPAHPPSLHSFLPHGMYIDKYSDVILNTHTHTICTPLPLLTSRILQSNTSFLRYSIHQTLGHLEQQLSQPNGPPHTTLRGGLLRSRQETSSKETIMPLRRPRKEEEQTESGNIKQASSRLERGPAVAFQSSTPSTLLSCKLELDRGTRQRRWRKYGRCA